MSAAHDLLVRTRAEQGLPLTLDDETTCEQIAMLLRNVKSAGDDDSRRPSKTTSDAPDAALAD